MKNNILYTLVFAGLVCFSGACTKKFEEINTDPNRPKTVTPGAILNQVQYSVVTAHAYTAAWGLTQELMQMHAPGISTGGGGIHRYEILPNTGLWSTYYGILTNIEDIYSIADKSNENNYKAIALVYKCWIYAQLTDLYGSIPYSEAMKAREGNFKPSFDDQKNIYEGIFSDLERANELFEVTKGLTSGGDIVYNADIMKWKKFCNSLKLRLLLRVLKREEELNISDRIDAILANTSMYPVFESNTDEAILKFTGTNPYFNPFHNARQLDWSETFYFTKFFVDKLNDDNDPRRTVWMTTVEVNGQAVYRGIESGYPPSHPIYVAGMNSTYSTALKTSPLLGIMMSYAEVEFIKAELAIKGFNTGKPARQHYEDGINASMAQWGVTAPGDFYSRSGILYNETGTAEEQLSQVMLQKYYALFFTDYQSWFEKRRTGYPNLPRGSGIPPENTFPNRLPYPTYLQSLNNEHLQAAISEIGGDKTSTKVWWQQ